MLMWKSLGQFQSLKFLSQELRCWSLLPMSIQAAKEEQEYGIITKDGGLDPPEEKPLNECRAD